MIVLSHDILDWGYWTNGGGYEPPVHEWREEICKDLGIKLPHQSQAQPVQ